MAIIVFLIILNILIVVHELGHYFLAKREGVVVKEFAVGLGPAIYKKEWNGTVWRLNVFPFGGYNSLKGESESEGGQGNFSTARKKSKLKILLAGSGMNLLLGILSFYLMMPFFGFKVPVIIDFKPIGAELVKDQIGSMPLITKVADNSTFNKLHVALPAELKEVGGQKPQTAEEVISTVQDNKAKGNNQITIVIREAGKQTDTTVVADYIDSTHVGMTLADIQQYKIDYGKNIFTIAFSGISHVANTVIVFGTVAGRLFSYVKQTNDITPVSYAVAGPVGVYSVVSDIVADNDITRVFGDLIHITGLISFNLAIFNLLPFPGLDGWHILIVFLEKIRKRKFNEQMLAIISIVGIVILLIFSVLITIKDVYLFFIK